MSADRVAYRAVLRRALKAQAAGVRHEQKIEQLGRQKAALIRALEASRESERRAHKEQSRLLGLIERHADALRNEALVFPPERTRGEVIAEFKRGADELVRVARDAGR